MPFEVTKQRAQANQNTRPLDIVKDTLQKEVQMTSLDACMARFDQKGSEYNGLGMVRVGGVVRFSIAGVWRSMTS